MDMVCQLARYKPTVQETTAGFIVGDTGEREVVHFHHTYK